MTKSSGEACGPSGPFSIAGRFRDQTGFLAAETARHLGVAALVQHDHRLRIAGSLHGGLEALGNREDGREDDDDAPDADDRDDGRPETLRDRSEGHASDRENLRQPVHMNVLSKRPGLSD